MTKWEYKTKALRDFPDGMFYTTIHHLDDLGQEGWELATISNGLAYFKRPMEDDNGKEEAEIKEVQEQENKEDQGEQEVYPQSREIFHRGYRQDL